MSYRPSTAREGALTMAVVLVGLVLAVEVIRRIAGIGDGMVGLLMVWAGVVAVLGIAARRGLFSGLTREETQRDSIILGMVFVALLAVTYFELT